MAEPKKKKKKKQKHLLFLRKLIPACECVLRAEDGDGVLGERERSLKTRMSNFPIFVSHLQLIWKMDFLACLVYAYVSTFSWWLLAHLLCFVYVSFKFRLFTHFKLQSLCFVNVFAR